VLVIGRPLAPDHIPGICDRACRLLEDSDDGVLRCDVGALVEPDAVDVDALARVQLTTTRKGGRLLLMHVPPRLKDLLVFLGLAEVIGLGD